MIDDMDDICICGQVFFLSVSLFVNNTQNKNKIAGNETEANSEYKYTINLGDTSCSGCEKASMPL
jgi:hypothetical protein